MTFNLDYLLENIARIAPNPYVQAILIVVLFVALAKIVDMFITRFMRRLMKKTLFTFDDQVLDIFHKPIFVSIMLFGLVLATDRLGFSANVYFVTVSGLKTIAIVIWSMAIARFLKLIVKAVSKDDSKFTLIQDRTLPLFNNLLVVLVVALALYSICLTWQIDMTAWMASAGILGLAVSFAAKDTLANLFSGVFIMADAPYKLGDLIVLDSGERGEVTHIGIRSTRLLTRDDVEITVPNAVMGNAKVTNEAGGPDESYRIRIKVGVAYDSDIDKVHEVLLHVAENQPEVCRSPAPRVRFRAFGPSSLDHELLCWVEKPVLRGRVTHLLNINVLKRFREEGIEIPFPQQDVHICTS
jgi:small-conductance mechanosensitive channel